MGQLLSHYRFRHILFQRYLYSSQDDVERVHLHERVGNRSGGVVRRAGTGRGNAVQLAMHFHKARIADKTVHYLHLAGDKALQLSAYQEARALLTRGLQLLMTAARFAPNEHKGNWDCSFRWALPGWETSRVPSGRTRSQGRAHCANKRGGRPTCVGRSSAVDLSLCAGRVFARPLEYAKEALSLAEQVGDPLAIAVSHWYPGLHPLRRRGIPTGSGTPQPNACLLSASTTPSCHGPSARVGRGCRCTILRCLLFMVPGLS